MTKDRIIGVTCPTIWLTDMELGIRPMEPTAEENYPYSHAADIRRLHNEEVLSRNTIVIVNGKIQGLL